MPPEGAPKQLMIRAKAPLRISFGGGGTDVSPYIEERGGVVISATVNKYAFGTLRPRQSDPIIQIKSLDLDVEARYETAEQWRFDGKLDLVKAVLQNFTPKQGFDLFLHSDAPPGSGLGSSSTVMVALIGLFKHWMKLPLTQYDVADLAYKLERLDLGIEGGKQDQYAAAFGGFNFIEFHKDATIVNPLKVSRQVVNELEYRCMLVYTGRTRLSANIIREQKERFSTGKTTDVLDQTKQLAVDLKNALLRGNLDTFGSLLHQGWELKKNFASKVSSPEIDKMYEAARATGAVGGKILGAGGGGYLLLFCEFDRKHEVAKEVRSLGGEPTEFAFEESGLQTWEVHG
ncbi:MAG TPA: GHMP kinase [Candidatus Thermoplasmatota archaeon]|nr:GHMP kinase [Candidatus Thermoplasmatota archaeon]